MLDGLNLNFDFVTQRIGLVKETGAIYICIYSISPFVRESSTGICYILT